MISQDHHFVFKSADQWMERSVIDISGSTVPAHDQPPLVQNTAQFSTHNPSMVREPLFTDLLFTSTRSIGMQQLDAVCISHTQDRCFSKETLCPVLMSGEQTKQAGSFRQLWEKGVPISHKPTIKGPIPNTFDGKQYCQGDDLLIYAVIPTYNWAELIERTLQSVLYRN